MVLLMLTWYLGCAKAKKTYFAKFDIAIKPRIIIYINFVDLESLKLHAEFQDYQTSCSGEKYVKVFTIYRHGSHLGHVTCDLH